MMTVVICGDGKDCPVLCNSKKIRTEVGPELFLSQFAILLADVSLMDKYNIINVTNQLMMEAKGTIA